MILDLFVIGIVLLFAFLGAKRGFTHSVLSLLNKIVSLIVALIFAKPFASVLLETPLATLAENIVAPISTSDITLLADSAISSTLQWWLLIAFSFIIIFIVAFFAFKLLQAFADAITSLPVLKQIDSLLGFILGVASCLLVIYILLGILSIFQDTTILTSTFEKINNSNITKFLYDNNLIVKVLFEN